MFKLIPETIYLLKVFNKAKRLAQDLKLLYLKKNILIIAILGYAKGIPFTLIFGTYTYKLAEDGLNLSDIGYFGLAGLPFAIKFIWSPLVDGLKIPLIKKLGQRRSWLIFSQVLLSYAIIQFILIDPSKGLSPLVYLAIIISFISATYDIAYDALRIDLLSDAEQGAGAAASIVGYRIGVLTSGGLSLIFAELFSWEYSFYIISASIIASIFATLWAVEPTKKVKENISLIDWLNEFIKSPLIDFINKHQNWLVILSFIILYKIGDALLGKMINPFYVEMQFTKAEVAEVTKFFGFAMTILGGIIGGWAVYRIGIIKSLFIFGLLQALSNLSFIWLAQVGHSVPVLTIVIAFENITGAMGTAAFVAYMSSLCNKQHTATQYALFTSIESLGRWSTNAPSGFLVDKVNGLGLSWELYFLITVIISIPALLMIKFLKFKES